MLKAKYCRYILYFKFKAITSRSLMTEKETFYLYVWDDSNPEIKGVGECALFRGLSADDTPDYEKRLKSLCNNIANVDSEDIEESSIRFGLETALADLAAGGKRNFMPSKWSEGSEGIKINGLVWMGDYDTMLQRVEEKIAAGFRCIKIKIGALDFERELQLIGYVREIAPEVEIRLDANGAFTPDNVLHRLEKLAKYNIHSIEQPIRRGQWRAMREVCRMSPIPIALDEELIGNLNYDSRCRLLDAIMPAYIILKPSLCGGFKTADGWIIDATDREIRWWATSALESDIGLNAIARWVARKDVTIPQGLGTGMLYRNNIVSPLQVEGDCLYNRPEIAWGAMPLSCD